MEEKRVVIRSVEGKTLTVYAKVNNGRLEEIVFGGDYFAYPEDSIVNLEGELRGMRLDEALKIIEEYLKDTMLLGISIEDLKESVRRILS